MPETPADPPAPHEPAASVSMRPTFDLDVAREPAWVADALAGLTDRPDLGVTGQRAGLHLTLTVTPEHRHFWSPWLNLEARPADGGGTSLHGRFSPAPSLWTGIMFTHLTLLTVAFFATMFGGAQLLMGNPPHALWVVPACAVGIALLWWVSLIGQRLAYEQMHLLRHAIEHELGLT